MLAEGRDIIQLKFLDQMGRRIDLSAYPKRIVSLVPSLTELLFDLGLTDEIIGVTDYCVYPQAEVAKRVKVGGPKDVRFAVIDRLAPDLIIGNKEENDRERIHQLAEHYPVWMSDISNVDDALKMIKGIGDLVNQGKAAAQLVSEIERELSAFPTFGPLAAAYVIWQNPYMAAGGGTYINSLLRAFGFINIFEEKAPYPQIKLPELERADVILLATEPYVFTDAEVDIFRKRFPRQNVRLIDGTMLAWYGSRLRLAPAYMRRMWENLKQ